MAFDTTDHFTMECPECILPMKVENVETRPVQGDNCTWIYAKCMKCGLKGKRKIYWLMNRGI